MACCGTQARRHPCNLRTRATHTRRIPDATGGAGWVRGHARGMTHSSLLHVLTSFSEMAGQVSAGPDVSEHLASAGVLSRERSRSCGRASLRLMPSAPRDSSDEARWRERAVWSTAPSWPLNWSGARAPAWDVRYARVGSAAAPARRTSASAIWLPDARIHAPCLLRRTQRCLICGARRTVSEASRCCGRRRQSRAGSRARGGAGAGCGSRGHCTPSELSLPN